ncbi:ATPase synthesis protein 25, mitochondrial [Scheffersomyces amazonensis]|uniref:ATPase synthesis protein 25, mitochondrial n=1 Tax=Scheffersomyces amazonensis TaxID=1078765 RepID=UPI00315D0DBD
MLSRIYRRQLPTLLHCRRNFSSVARIFQQQEETESVPWFLREKVSSPLSEKEDIKLPVVPEDAPPFINDIIKLIGEEYGLEDLELFDLRFLPEDHQYSSKNQPHSFILIGTGKSEKHLFKAASELRLFIKQTYNILPRLEGVVSSGISPVARRRLLRRGSKGPPSTDNIYGVAPNSWVVCDPKKGEIIIHMLTKERRNELELETLWCEEKDMHKYERKVESDDIGDDIFIGINRSNTFSNQRREFSTTTRLLNLRKTVDNFKNSDKSKVSVEDFKTEFDNKFQTNKDHQMRIEFYKQLHILNPNYIPLSKVTEAIYDKHSNLNFQIDREKEITQDIIYFMNLLMDSPEAKELSTDLIFNELSQFIANITRFSSNYNVLSQKGFLVLLWRLSIKQEKDFIGPKIIDDILVGNKKISELSFNLKVEQPGNRARDVMFLINKFYKGVIPHSFKELILFTYGNTSKWDKFWEEWDSSFGFLNTNQDTNSINKWIRLVTYLAIRNDKTSMIDFLYKYWNNSSSPVESFIESYITQGSKFSSEQEKLVFQSALRHILTQVDSEAQNFSHVHSFVNNLN